jgi:hypothetical protein
MDHLDAGDVARSWLLSPRISLPYPHQRYLNPIRCHRVTGGQSNSCYSQNMWFPYGFSGDVAFGQ